MRRTELVFSFVILTAMALFTVALTNMVNDPNLQPEDIQVVLETSMSIK